MNDRDLALQPVRSRGVSVETRFRPSSNSLNLIRLVLATAVIVSHAGPITGRNEITFGGQTLGSWAVTGFFFVSGFLITRSRLERTPGEYFRDRALRIFPAYVVMLPVVAFVVAPTGAALSDEVGYDAQSAFSFLLHNLPLAPPYLLQGPIGDSPPWNGPIYTLFYEFGAYVVISLLVSFVPERHLGRVLLASGAVLTLSVLLMVNSASLGPKMQAFFLTSYAAPFGLAFVVGASCWIYRGRVPLDRRAVSASAAALLLVVLSDQARALAPVPLGLLLLWAAVVLPWRRFGRRVDISYGVYIYGWPVQILVVVAIPRLQDHMAINLAVVVGTAAALGLASCLLIERPALARKSHAGSMPRVERSRPGSYDH